MKFLVTRTSLFDGRVSPCEGAVLYKDGGEWDSVWTIELADLDALMRFVRDNECVVIAPVSFTTKIEGLPEIEIYDTYRE